MSADLSTLVAMVHGIVPPYLLARLAQAGAPRLQEAAQAAQHTLRRDDVRRAARLTLSVEGGALVAEVRDAPDRTISDAKHTDALPGTTVRREGEGPVQDVAVNEAYDGLGATFALYSEVYGRDSIDGKGLPLDGTVHYERDYDNAFWNGERMVFGDGDGQVFGRFTASVDVIGHELTHGVTQYTTGLVYKDQAGALNESISDVFGSLVLQYAARQTVAEASWLIGAGLFTPAVHGVALRSMKAPGTAYDDPVLGKDPQPATMAGYVHTTDDDGGVHTNSGIPNHAFYLVAARIGGHAWETAGRIWYDTLLAGMKPDTDFAGFAAHTLAAAVARYGEGSAEADAVRAGWSGVGVAIDGAGPR
ncbi:M4 family metallopeptidase [Mesorhizobium japonicum]|uniref:M4 family metallopeptidase n=1 Tax=Mesorhizobium japonicum TaxID=2066070 RepID=UPI003B5B0394